MNWPCRPVSLPLLYTEAARCNTRRYAAGEREKKEKSKKPSSPYATPRIRSGSFSHAHSASSEISIGYHSHMQDGNTEANGNRAVRVKDGKARRAK